MDKLVLVTGATGQQGGAVATRLLAGGWRVQALTRDVSSEKARGLAAAGAEVVAGDQQDRSSLDSCIQGAYGVFSVQAGPLAPGQDELRSGKNIADAAKAQGVTHLVYSSGNSTELAAETGMAREKWEIEEYIRSLGISATILRPTSFMENYWNPQFGLRSGALTTALLPTVSQQLIALDDIAALAALAFEHPDEYRGKILELAGDALTPPQIGAAISGATGHTVPYQQLPIEALRQQNERFARGYEFMNSGKATQADIPALRTLHPDLMTFETWLERKGAAKLKELLG